jgi:putative endonuclease
MHPLPHCVYVLISQKDGKLYVGYTTDLMQRVADHNAGKNTSTAPRRPLKLAYCEFHTSQGDAERREKYFKTTAGKRALGLMLRDALETARHQ